MLWTTDKRSHVVGQIAHLGPWCVGTTHYDGLLPRHATNRFRATCLLPGMNKLTWYETEEQAKEQVNQMVRSWLAQIPAEDKI